MISAGSLSCCLFASASAQDLLTVLRDAARDDPQYQAAVHRAKAEMEQLPQARSLLLPQLGASVGFAQTDQRIVSSDNSVFAVGSNDFGTVEANVGLDLALFSYSDYQNLGRAKQEKMRAEAELMAAEQDLMLRVADRYFEALAVLEVLREVRAEVAALGEHMRLADAQGRRGIIRRAEAMDVRAQAFEAEAREIEVKMQLADALQGINEMVGYVPTTLSV